MPSEIIFLQNKLPYLFPLQLNLYLKFEWIDIFLVCMKWCVYWYSVIIFTLLCFIVTVWEQDDLLKLLDAMKTNLPDKDLSKYKTSESHLDWEKIAFNSYSAEMCKQKWLEVSREVR